MYYSKKEFCYQVNIRFLKIKKYISLLNGNKYKTFSRLEQKTRKPPKKYSK